MRPTKRNPGAGDARVSEIVLEQQTTDGSHYSALTADATTTLPFRSIGELAAEIAADLVFRHKARLLHRKGERVFGAFLAHVAADRALATCLESEIDRFLALDGTAFDLVGARELPPSPLTRIHGGWP